MSLSTPALRVAVWSRLHPPPTVSRVRIPTHVVQNAPGNYVHVWTRQVSEMEQLNDCATERSLLLRRLAGVWLEFRLVWRGIIDIILINQNFPNFPGWCLHFPGFPPNALNPGEIFRLENRGRGCSIIGDIRSMFARQGSNRRPVEWKALLRLAANRSEIQRYKIQRYKMCSFKTAHRKVAYWLNCQYFLSPNVRVEINSLKIIETWGELTYLVEEI